MKGIWRKCLSLTAGLLAASAQAAGPSGEPAPERIVIARTAPPAAAISRPVIAGTVAAPAVTLDRPRFAETAVQQVGFATPAQPTIRAQAPEVAPPPSPTDGFAYAPTPPFLESQGVPGFTEPMMTARSDDRFAPGDGITSRFNNFIEFENDYLLWGMREQRVRPLVVAGMPMPGDSAVMLPMFSQTVLGGKSEDTPIHSGYRLRLTAWFDRDHTVGLEGGYFFLGQTSQQDMVGSAGMPLLAIPFIAGTTPTSALIAGGGFTGGAATSLETRLWGAEANIRTNLVAGPHYHLDVLLGYRIIGLDDNFHFGVTRTDGVTTTIASDTFDTRNRFQGGQLGLASERQWGHWSLGLTAKLGLGVTKEHVEAAGFTLADGRVVRGGVFADGPNLGGFKRQDFGLISEVGLKVGYQFSDHLRATVGYNLLWWNDTVRAAEQIDPVINGVNHPAVLFRTSDFWAQGFSAGLELRY